MKAKTNSIALFGTSADPPTLGHESLLGELIKIFPKVITWASDNPDKKHQIPLLKRSELLRILVKKISNPKLEIVQELSSPRTCLLYTSPSPRDGLLSRMPSSA